jgi:hypothetical protein
MKKDIEIPKVKNVRLAVTRKKNIGERDEWMVYIINNNDQPIENTIVSSQGYGEKDGEEQKTSTLRHFLETVPANTAVVIEPIDSGVFHLNNEYWVSYFLGGKMYDKRFVFFPNSICEENIILIKELEMEGVLHF